VQITGKTVLLTGAGGGIGRALSLELVRRGARVALADVDPSGLDALQAEIEARGGQAVTLGCDVRDEGRVQNMVHDALVACGTLDILINSAGVTLGGDIKLLSEEDWERVFSINLWGVVRTVRAVLPHMLERGSGYIVNIASAAGLVAPALWIPYATSKFAVVGFSEGLCAAVRPKGIGVSVVCPMWVQTDLIKGPLPRLSESPGPRPTPVGPRLGRAAAWLAERLPGRQMTTETAARRIIRGIERERFLVYTHRWTWLIVLGRAIAPEIFSRLWDRVNDIDEARHRARGPG
jgi:NAD(P)-dependent dehydrogenase (short-subunit alcohol dehydrogenase family)